MATQDAITRKLATSDSTAAPAGSYSPTSQLYVAPESYSASLERRIGGSEFGGSESAPEQSFYHEKKEEVPPTERKRAGTYSLRGEKIKTEDSMKSLAPGAEFYVSAQIGNVPPGSYIVEKGEVAGAGGKGTGSITGHKEWTTWAVNQETGEKYEIKKDVEAGSESWDWWNNPLNPLSWFS